jgi:phenylpropionate dioxygenase-like ring-hydroxylating dioxygenase large terminal subunit
LIVDNLLDLTHLAFVHETTIGNAALVERAKGQGRACPNNVPAGPSTRRRRVKAGGFTANVDRWQIINFVPPAFLRLDVGCAPTGTGASHGRRAGGINMRNLNAIKPETETIRLGHSQPRHHRHAGRADRDRVPRGRCCVGGATANPNPLDGRPSAREAPATASAV